MAGWWFESFRLWFPDYPRVGWVFGKVGQSLFTTMITAYFLCIPVLGIEIIYRSTTETFHYDGLIEPNQTESFIIEYENQGFFIGLTTAKDGNVVHLLADKDSTPDSSEMVFVRGIGSNENIFHDCLGSSDTDEKCSLSTLKAYRNYVAVGYFEIMKTDLITISNNHSYDLFLEDENLQTPFMDDNIIDESYSYLMSRAIDFPTAFIFYILFVLGVKYTPLGKIKQ